MVAPAALAPTLTPVVKVDGEVRYALQPKQLEAYRLTPLARRPDEPYTRHIGYGGAAGGGKSHLARAVAVAAALLWPGSTGIIFRLTKDEVEANHVNKFLEEFPQKDASGRRIYSWNGSKLLATFVNGSRIYFAYLREERDKFRYQGNEYDFMIFEEATHYAWESVRWLTGNRLRATKPYCRPFVLYPSNPGNIGHAWYKRLFIDRRYDPALNEEPDQYAFVQARVEDNAVLMERDPAYLRELQTLPEPYRSWLMRGDWNTGMGLALMMLHRGEHFVPPFTPPAHWPHFGAFDWGYAHPFSFGVYCVDEDGRLYKRDTITGRYMQPHEIAERVAKGLADLGLEVGDLQYVAAGHDLWNEVKARGENTPTLAEVFQHEHGWPVTRANIGRIDGLNNLREYLAWQRVEPVKGEPIENWLDDDPYLRFMDTQGNRACFDQLETLPSDPKRPEDALKIDADAFGNGGDDCYDETRYAAASRPPVARGSFKDTAPRAFSREVLEHEARENRRHRSKPLHEDAGIPASVIVELP